MDDRPRPAPPGPCGDGGIVAELDAPGGELRFLADAGALLASTLDYDSTVREVADLVVPALADWCVIDVLDEDGTLQSVQIAAADPERGALLREMLRRFPHVPAPSYDPVDRVLVSREPVLVPEVTPEFLAASVGDPEHLRILETLAPESAIFVPLCARGQVVGAMTLVASGSGRRFAEHDLWLAGELARRAALAIENARLYRRAQQASRAREEVLGIVAHDLRNPLSAITMVGSLLLEDYLSREQSHEQIRAMLRTAEQMDRLIEDLLDVARIDAGTLSVEPAPTSLERIAREAARLLEPAAHERGVRVELEIEPGLPDAWADADRVLQVLSNLLSNAIRYTPRESTVTVRAGQLGAELLVSVTDAGRGIAPEHMPHLFDRYWQAHPQNGAGAGLGLSIAHGIVEAHGGRIWATSEPGQGATLLFTLPLAEEQGATIGAHASLTVGPAGEPDPEPVRVFVVDDHPAIRRGVRSLLERAEGIEVVADVGSGEEAVALASRLHPDVVVMDLGLQGMSGIEAMRAITEAHPEVRVVALTARPEATAALAVLEAGGSGFVEKTSAHEELVAAVRTAARDEVYLHGTGNRVLLRALQGADEPRDGDPLASLSPNERQILTLAAQGYTAAEIGRKLFLSPSTVASYRSRAMRQLGLHDRASLVRLVLDHGMMERTGQL